MVMEFWCYCDTNYIYSTKSIYVWWCW
jgi:hypothetical protein